MTKFKLGDTVRVIAENCRYFDQVGAVVAIHEDQGFPYRIDRVDVSPIGFEAHELILADPHHEMINDPEGQQLVQAIHDRKEKP